MTTQIITDDPTLNCVRNAVSAMLAPQAAPVAVPANEIPQAAEEPKAEAVQYEIPQTVVDNLPLTAEPEKESPEVAQYENKRTEHWTKFYEKNSGTLPVLLTHPQVLGMVWKSVDTDVENFKASLYQIVG